MTLEELEKDPSSKFIAHSINESEPEQVMIPLNPHGFAKWRCKECDVLVDGPPADMCQWCARYEENLVALNHAKEEFDSYVFTRRKTDGTSVRSYISEDGRIVDLDD